MQGIAYLIINGITEAVEYNIHSASASTAGIYIMSKFSSVRTKEDILALGRFSSIDEAINNFIEIISRTEHIAEFYISNFNETYRVSWHIKTEK